MASTDDMRQVSFVFLEDLTEDDLNELDWDSDPMLILERKEQADGYNCFGHPIQ